MIKTMDTRRGVIPTAPSLNWEEPVGASPIVSPYMSIVPGEEKNTGRKIRDCIKIHYIELSQLHVSYSGIKELEKRFSNNAWKRQKVLEPGKYIYQQILQKKRNVFIKVLDVLMQKKLTKIQSKKNLMIVNWNI
jgi:hypothetical protein